MKPQDNNPDEIQYSFELSTFKYVEWQLILQRKANPNDLDLLSQIIEIAAKYAGLRREEVLMSEVQALLGAFGLALDRKFKEWFNEQSIK